jgi:hypothetical protein
VPGALHTRHPYSDTPPSDHSFAAADRECNYNSPFGAGASGSAAASAHASPARRVPVRRPQPAVSLPLPPKQAVEMAYRPPAPTADRSTAPIDALAHSLYMPVFFVDNLDARETLYEAPPPVHDRIDHDLPAARAPGLAAPAWTGAGPAAPTWNAATPGALAWAEAAPPVPT